jgi:hypothetical protein
MYIKGKGPETDVRIPHPRQSRSNEAMSLLQLVGSSLLTSLGGNLSIRSVLTIR